MEMLHEGDILVSNEQYEFHRYGIFKDILATGTFVDVTLVCDDGQLDAHKVVLSVASPFFQTLLEENPISHPVIHICGSKKKSIISLLEFIYSGETSIHSEHYESFLSFAEHLQILGLDQEQSDQNKVDKQDDVQNDIISDFKEEIDSLHFKNDENLWACKVCVYISHKKHHVKEHVERHTANFMHQCKLCTKVFQTRVGLRNHKYVCPYTIQNEIKQKLPLQVDMENEADIKNASKQSDMQRELKREIPFEISESCRSEQGTKESDFTGLDQKVQSLLIKIGAGRWACKVCDYKSTKSHVKEHVEEHIEGYTHACETCGKVFKKRIVLRQHRKRCLGQQ
jgi:hypothetical protein